MVLKKSYKKNGLIKKHLLSPHVFLRSNNKLIKFVTVPKNAALIKAIMTVPITGPIVSGAIN